MVGMEIKLDVVIPDLVLATHSMQDIYSPPYVTAALSGYRLYSS
jgi:hypothetical protein